MKSKIRMEVDFQMKAFICIYLADKVEGIDEDPRDQMLRALVYGLTNHNKRSQMGLNDYNHPTHGEGSCRKGGSTPEEERELKIGDRIYYARKSFIKNKDTYFSEKLPTQFSSFGFTNCLIQKVGYKEGYEIYKIIPVEYQEDIVPKIHSSENVGYYNFIYRDIKTETGFKNDFNKEVWDEDLKSLVVNRVPIERLSDVESL